MIRHSIYCFCALLPFSVGAQSSISLMNGNRLTAEVQQLLKSGECVIQLVTNEVPVTLKSNTIECIEFGNDIEDIEHHSENIILANGDSLPCSILGLKDNQLEINTHFGGSFLIQLNQIKSLSFNHTFEPIIYQGPNHPNEWAMLSNWQIDQGSLQTSNNAEASIKLPLPSNFSISFNVKWDGDRPRFKLYLCADAQRKADSKGCYFIDFNTSNIQVYRSTPSRTKQRIGEMPIRLKEVSMSSAFVEVKVDRKLQQVAILIDGKNVGTFDDTEVSAPMGNWTILEANMQNESLSLSEISIKESADIFFTGKHPDDPVDTKLDTLYDKEGRIYSGKLLDIMKSDDGPELRFENKHSKDPLLVPLAQAHTVYLEKNESYEPVLGNYILEVQGGGKLHLLDFTLNEATVLTSHPILGEIALPRTALTRLTKQTIPNEK
ncbi:hypothetical protein [Rubritalea sp.]|uniref:hypothetical protein n=1 Tax=Rubritalea sp. TaxID=2109375 RepID=UPI003EF411E3